MNNINISPKTHIDKYYRKSNIIRVRIQEKIAFALLWFSGIISVGALVVILSYIITNGIKYVSLDFILNEPVRAGQEGGISSIIIGTGYVIGLALAIAAPIGIMASIYLTEYAKEGPLIRIIRFATETLAGIPSIIYGLFGFVFFVIYLKLQFSVLSGALTLTIMILPTIIRTSEESLKCVPMSFREASLALGATKWATIRRVVIPTAVPGIITGIILSMGRAIGESAALMLTAGGTWRTPENILRPARTLAVHIYILASEGIAEDNAYATATVLIIIILIINFIANKIIRRCFCLKKN